MVTQITQGALGNAFASVYLRGTLYQGQPITDVQLVQGYGSHDMVYVRIEYPPQQAALMSQLNIWGDDTPVAVQWGRVPDVNTWYGYVNHHEINSAADSGTNVMQVTYVLTGTSLAMNSATTTMYQNESITSLARRTAAKYGLRSVTTPTRFSLKYEAATGESDFQFLKRLAHKTGMRFWVSSGTLYMVDPVVIFQGAGQNAVPTFLQNKVIGTADTCRNFRYSKGRNVPGSVQANRTVYGIDATTGQEFSATASSPGTTRAAVSTFYATQSYADAYARMVGWQNLSQFWITATADLYGNTSVYPGKLIAIFGNALPDGSAGYWLVSKVTHSITLNQVGPANTNQFLSSATLIRNKEAITGSAVPATLSQASTAPVMPEFTKMNLNQNGQWVSVNRGPVVITS